jgi:hypothetical protein
MNIDLNFVLDWFKTFGKPNPTRDWLSILAISTVIFIAGAAWAGYIFLGIQTGSLIQAGSDAHKPPAPISRAEIQKVLDLYRARVANYQAQNFPSYPLNDPHISSGPKK